MRLFLVIFAVEALAASWIEIFAIDDFTLERMSKPLRLRGLKYFLVQVQVVDQVSKPLRLRGLK